MLRKRGVTNDVDHVFEYVSSPYVPYQREEFTFTPEFVAETIQRMLDIQGGYVDVLRSLNMPPSYVILDRVVWGVSALLGRMQATGNWKARLAEYRKGEPPSTELGRIEAEWAASRSTAGR